jgi:SAM-dependent methyltransferase
MRPEAGLERARRRLVRVLVDRARGRTLVVGEDEALGDALRAVGRKVEAVSRDDLQELERSALLPRTAILHEVLQDLSPEDAKALLHTLWGRVVAGGRMLVVVPNGDAIQSSSANRRMSRTALEEELSSLGPVRLVTDQPYRWIVARLDKPGGPSLPARDRLERYRVTARLCRGRVVELGCGVGHLAGVVHGRGLEVTGVDMSEAKIRQARSLYPGIAFQTGDIRSVVLPDGSFDTVVLAEVLEHVPETEGDAILERAWRLLRGSGRLVVSVPNEDCVPHRNHVRRFERSTLESVLSRWGTPRVILDQPYKWLLMTVEKKS